MQTLRKILAISVIFVTVLSMSVVVAPKANAAASAGDLIKMSGLSSVYYLGADGKRYVFPNESTYFSWYSDFSSVVTVPQSELEALPLGKNVTVRPGTKLVKITTNPNVYAVTPGGVLVRLPSEAVASTLYGANWAKRVIDVSDAFFTNYNITGTDVSATAYPAGSLIKAADMPEVYYINADGTASKIASETAFNANRLSFANVITTTLAIPTLGADITGAVSSISDTSSGAGGTIPAGGSGLTVALASNTPASATIPSSATGVVFTKFNVTASNDGAVTISALTVKRSGVGASTDLPKVYLYEGATRLTTGKSLSASTNDATFTNIGYVVPAGTTKTLSIVADTKLSTSGNDALGIEMASSIATNGAVVSGSFPVTGNTMSISTTNVGKMDVESNGSTYTRKTGETAVEVANFTVYVDSVEDGTFKAITLYNSGRDVLNNLKMYKGSTLVASATKSGNYFTFVLDTPTAILKGDSAQFTVKGDVTGRAGDTATLDIRYGTDVSVTGNTYGYNLAASAAVGGNLNSYIEDVATSTAQQNVTTVQAGQLTAAFNGPVAGNVSKNTNKVDVLDFSLTSQSNVDVSKYTIALSGSSTAADVANLSVVIDGVTVSTVAAPVIGNNTFTDTFSLPAGKTVTGKILVDVTTGAVNTDTIRATIMNLKDTSLTTVKSDAGDVVTDIVPSGNIAGNLFTVTAASLTVNIASNPAAGSTFVKGTANAPVAGFAFTAGAATDVQVNSVKLTAYLSNGATTTGGWIAADKGAVSGAADVIAAVTIYDAANPTTPLATKKSLTVGTADITVTFDSLNWIIPKGTSKSLIAKVDISTTAPKSGNNDTIALVIADAGSLTAQYGNGTNLGATVTTGNQTPTIYQIVSAGGTIAMVTDAATPQAGLVLAGTANVPYTKVKFTATQEDYVVDKLRVVNSANDTNFTSVSLSYKDKAGTTQTATSILVSGVADFNNLTVFVPKDGSAVVTVIGNTNTVTGGASNGAASYLSISGTANFEAFGQGSSVQATNSLSSANADGTSQKVFESIPSFAFAADTPTGNLIPSANTVVAKLNISVSGAKDITFTNSPAESLVVNFAQSGGTSNTTTVSLVDVATGLTLCTATPNLTTTAFTCDFATNSLTVAAGTTKTVNVVVDTTTGGFTSIGRSIQAYLSGASANNVIWGINGVGTYATGNVTFRGNIYGGSLIKP